MENSTTAGSYQLTGIMETGAGLELYPDGKFDFYYVYGAIDRHAYGNWKQEGDVIMLHSPYADKSGYDILLSEHRQQPRFTVYMPKADPFFLSMQTVYAINGDVTEAQQGDKKGWYLFTCAQAEKIMLSNDLFPDRLVTIDLKDRTHNHIELAPNHDLLLIQFDDVKANLHEKGLYINSPFLKGMHGDRQFNFTRIAQG